MNRSFLMAMLLAVGCTPNENEQSALDESVVEPVERPGEEALTRSGAEDPARTEQCNELSGQALRDCLERAQYMPREGVGRWVEPDPETQRENPDQIHLPPEQMEPTPADDIVDRKEDENEDTGEDRRSPVSDHLRQPR